MSLSDQILKDIYRIQRIPSTLEKEKILMSYNTSITFRKILFHTYNPYMRYHIRKIPKNIYGKGYKEISNESWTLLSKLTLRKLTGIAARESLFEHLESLSESSCRILKMVVKKDLRCGIATKTINKCFPNLIPVFECQEVEEWSNVRARYPMLISPKLDGNRGEFRGGRMYSKRGHDIVGMEHIAQYIRSTGLTMDLSGELLIPGMPFRRASGIVKSNKAEKPNVIYAVFDIPSLGTMPLNQRLKHLSRIFKPYGSKGVPVVHIPHTLIHSLEDADKMYNYWLKYGYEGLVGKDPDRPFKAGKSHDWMRKVNSISAEYRIIDIYEGEGRLRGKLGGIIIEGNIRVGSGFMDLEREKYFKKPNLIIGKYATVVAKEKTATNSLRQPIFKEIRWDI
jgi:ATP-dependent DNA ligase